MQKFFKEMMDDRTIIKNNFPEGKSNIKAVELHKIDPSMEVIFRSNESSHSVTLRNHYLFSFYQRCVDEYKRGEEGNPNYCLSKEILRKIEKHPQFKASVVQIPRDLKATQADVNALYMDYYDFIMSKMNDSTVFLLGDKHNFSLCQNLIAFEILKDRLEHLFIELTPKGLENYVGQQSAITHNKELIYNNGDSFGYLSNLALAQGIPVTAVETAESRAAFVGTLVKNLKESKETLPIERDRVMSAHVMKKFPLTTSGNCVVLCGAAHIRGLQYFLTNKGYHVVPLDIDNFPLQTRFSRYTLIKTMVFTQDNREIHARVLTAKTAHAIENNSLVSVKDEIEEIDSDKNSAEVKISGAICSPR